MSGLVKKILGQIGYSVLSPFFHKQSLLNCAEAESILNEFSPRPVGSALCPLKNQIDNIPQYDLQIIIPAYNVEKYIGECLDSIFLQKTKYKYLVVVINDGSTDNTLAIINQYTCYNNIIAISQENKGFSGARNTGLAHIYSKYIMFVDSDDYILPGTIDALLDAAYLHMDCDIIAGGSYLYTDRLIKNIEYRKNTSVNSNFLKGFPCMKIFKSYLFENIKFPIGYWYEDTILPFLIYPQVEKAYLIKDMIYVYRQIPTSISHAAYGKPKSIDSYYVTEQMIKDCMQLSCKMDGDMLKVFLMQVLCNQLRCSILSDEIQEAVFVKSSKLLEHFEVSLVQGRYSRLYSLLKQKDFGNYKLWCKTHR